MRSLARCNFSKRKNADRRYLITQFFKKDDHTCLRPAQVEKSKKGSPVSLAPTLEDLHEQRSAEIFAAIDDFREQWLLFEQDDSRKPKPHQEWYVKAAQIPLVLAAGAIPGRLLPLIAPVEEFATVLVDWITSNRHQRDNYWEYEPTLILYGAGRNVLEADRLIRRPVILQRMETLSELIEQCVGPEQISAMTGHTLQEIADEKAKPGSVTGVDGYVMPILKKQQQQSAEQPAVAAVSPGIVLQVAISRIQELKAERWL